MHILLTTDTVGGVWQYSLTLAAALCRHEVAVTLAVVGPPPSAAQLAAVLAVPGLDCQVYPGRLEWQPGSPADLTESADWLGALAQRLRVDLIHSNQFAYGALRVGIPVLVAAHSDLFSWHAACDPLTAATDPAWRDHLTRYRTVVEAGLVGAAAVVCPSHAMAAALAMHYTGGARATVIYNGVCSARTNPQSAIRTPHCLRVLSVGRLWDRAKGLDWLAEAVGDGLPGLDVAVAGDLVGPNGAAPAVRAGIRTLGALDHADLLTTMAGADLYVGLSRYEPFGLAPLEAATQGCALLLRDIPTFRELWGADAIYCRSAADVRATLLAVAAGSVRLRSAQVRAARYSVARMIAAYLRLYGRLSEHGAGMCRPVLAALRESPLDLPAPTFVEGMFTAT